jgi:hypothetical protein
MTMARRLRARKLDLTGALSPTPDLRMFSGNATIG